MYFDDAIETMEMARASDEARLIFSFNGLAILLLGILPGALMSVCLGAMFAVEGLGF
jgi:NADH-quinone oxidoreductase subunit N